MKKICEYKNYAENGIRTHAGNCPPDLKSGALPGFAISACEKKLTNTNLLLYMIVMIYIVFDYALSSISILTLSGTLTFITCLIALSSASIPTRRL